MSAAPGPSPWPLGDGVVTLRPPQPGEETVLIAGRDSEWQRWLGPGDDQPRPTAVIVVGDEIVGWVDYDTDGDWLGPDEVNIGYNVFAPHRRRGYAARAVGLLLGFLSDHTSYRQANLVIEADNAASLGVARAVGAVVLSPTFDEAGMPSSIRHGVNLTSGQLSDAASTHLDRELISSVAHRWHPIAAPVSDGSVRQLIDRSGLRPGWRVLDLGCGSGAWVLSLLARQPEAQVVGVDRSPLALHAARSAEAKRGLRDQVEWVQADAATWRGGQFDLVLCVGASHAFGGLDGTLSAVRQHLAPGGRAILGATVWEVAPSQEAQDALGVTVGDLEDVPGLVAAVRGHGFEVSYGHISTLAEWDEYEWCWTAAVTQWALEELTDATTGQEVLHIADQHRTAWLSGYRGELGFVCVVLHDLAAH